MRNLIFAINIILILFSCGPSALNYNDALIEPQTKIAAGLDTIFDPASSVQKIGEMRTQIVDFANDGLSRTLKSGDFENETEFKNAATKYYSFVMNYFSDEELDSLLYKINSSERMKTLDSTQIVLIQKDLKAYLKIEDDFLSAQKTFAEKHKLKLRE